MSDFVTPEQAADRLQVTRRTVYNWLRSGALPGLKIGPRFWRIAVSDLSTFPQKPPSPRRARR